MSSPRKITLRSSDGESFEVEESVALQLLAIMVIYEDCCTDDGIALPNVNSKILAKVIEYCKKHEEARMTEDRNSNNVSAAAVGTGVDDELKIWEAEFVKVDRATLFDLILAANYLNIKGLLDLTCQTVADMIKGKTPEEIREILNIQNDFFPEEENDFFPGEENDFFPGEENDFFPGEENDFFPGEENDFFPEEEREPVGI